MTRLLPSNGIGSVEYSIVKRNRAQNWRSEVRSWIRYLVCRSNRNSLQSIVVKVQRIHTYKSVRMSLFHFHFKITHVIFQMMWQYKLTGINCTRKIMNQTNISTLYFEKGILNSLKKHYFENYVQKWLCTIRFFQMSHHSCLERQI